MNATIIPIGQTCNITFLLQNAKLKKQTSLFEWFVSNRLNHITDILNKIVTKTDNTIITATHRYIYIGNENIYSEHYKLDEFKDIYIRRRDRLLETIQESTSILFIRFEGSIIINNYTHKEIDEFISIIRKINPSLEKITLLLITNNPIKLEHPSVVEVFYNKHSSDPMCTGAEINTIFINALRSVGYDTTNTITTIFTDKSYI